MLLETFYVVRVYVTAIEMENIAIGLLITLFIWRTSKVMLLYSRRPRHMKIIGKTLLVGQWLISFDFILQGVNRITDAYNKASNLPFAIPGLLGYQVLVSSEEHIQELAQSPEDVMSFRTAMNERLFFKHTMGGFQPNHIDPNNSIPNRVFKTLARENLQKLSGPIRERIKEVIAAYVEKGRKKDGSIEVSALYLSQNLIARMNNQLLFGEEFAKDEKFEKESIRYGWHSSIAMEIFRQVPAAFVPLVAKTFMIWSGSMHRVKARVQRLVNQRLQESPQGSKKEHLDCTEWVIATSQTPEQKHPLRIAQQMMALLFASTHQMQMALTWAIIDLCTHKEFIAPLRAEIQSAFSSDARDPYERLYLMESFLRESSRLNPIDSLNVQRKTMKPFTFSDGSHVPAGNLVAVPQREVMRDSQRYNKPHDFNPFRFMRTSTDSTQVNIKYTDLNWSYTFWGSPRLPCPGRWYASYALRQVLTHLLMNYEIELLPHNASHFFIWTTAMVPRSDMHILLRPRECVEVKYGV